MARPSKHLISRPHPAKRYIDKIRLLQFRRGPTDDRWEAIFFRDGKWQTRQPHGLGTRHFEDACEVARDKYGLLTNGQQVTRTYTRPEPPKPKIEHPIRLYAYRAAKKLSEQAIQADAEVPGKGHNYRTVARRIEHDLVPRWGDTDIRRLDEHALNDWIEDDYRVEDRDATVAKYGGAGLSVPVIAEWLGTSSQMIERHYNQYLTERNAYLLNGISARVINPIPDPWRVPADDELDEMADR